MQAVKGYVENGQFFPLGTVWRLPGRIKAVLTVLDEPVENSAVASEKNAVQKSGKKRFSDYTGPLIDTTGFVFSRNEANER